MKTFRVEVTTTKIEYYKVEANALNFFPKMRFERDLSNTMPGGRRVQKTKIVS